MPAERRTFDFTIYVVRRFNLYTSKLNNHKENIKVYLIFLWGFYKGLQKDCIQPLPPY